MSDGLRIGRAHVEACPNNPMLTSEDIAFPSHRWECMTVQAHPRIEGQYCTRCGAERIISEDKPNRNPHVQPGWWAKLKQEMEAQS